MSTEGLAMVLEHAAVGVAALTGVLAARGKHVDLFGVIVLAVVTAFGGGTMRDIMLGEFPIIWVREPHLLTTSVAVAVVAFFVVRLKEPPQLALLIADAFVLALFTTIGAKSALRCQAAAPVAIAMGVITGVAGGIIRDTLTGEIPMVFRREIYLYATAALFGAAMLVMLNRFGMIDPWRTVLATGTTLVLRLVGIRWRIALPVFHTEKTQKEKSS